MRVNSINTRYRGFDLGFSLGMYGYLPAWRSSFDTDWHVSSMYAKDRDDVQRLAQDCIDYKYRVEASETERGRKLTFEEMRPENL